MGFKPTQQLSNETLADAFQQESGDENMYDMERGRLLTTRFLDSNSMTCSRITKAFQDFDSEMGSNEAFN